MMVQELAQNNVIIAIFAGYTLLLFGAFAKYYIEDKNKDFIQFYIMCTFCLCFLFVFLGALYVYTVGIKNVKW